MCIELVDHHCHLLLPYYQPFHISDKDDKTKPLSEIYDDFRSLILSGKNPIKPTYQDLHHECDTIGSPSNSYVKHGYDSGHGLCKLEAGQEREGSKGQCNLEARGKIIDGQGVEVENCKWMEPWQDGIKESLAFAFDKLMPLGKSLIKEILAHTLIDPIKDFKDSKVKRFYFYSVNVVDALLNVAYLSDEFKRSERYCLGVGIHPYYLTKVDDINKEIDSCVSLISYLKEHYPQALKGGLGEIGLDKRLSTPLSEQVKVLRAFLESTMDFKLPYSFHCVRAYDELYKFLQERPFKGLISGCVHGFNGSAQQALNMSKIGLKIGLGASLLAEQNFRKFSSIVTALPKECFCFESDFDGRNNSSYDGELIKSLSERFDQLQKL